jgi:hypothetical protein
VRVPDRGTTDPVGVEQSAQTNGDRGGSCGVGCCRHRGARAGAERRRFVRADADDLGARDDASGVVDGDPPADHAAGVLDAARDDPTGVDLAGPGADVVPAGHDAARHDAADHLPAADPRAAEHHRHHHLAAAVVLLPGHDAAGVVDSGPVRSHR